MYDRCMYIIHQCQDDKLVISTSHSCHSGLAAPCGEITCTHKEVYVCVCLTKRTRTKPKNKEENTLEMVRLTYLKAGLA